MTDIKPEGLEAARNAIRYLSHPETPWSDEQVAAVINAYLAASPPSPAPAESGAVAWVLPHRLDDPFQMTVYRLRSVAEAQAEPGAAIPLFLHPSPAPSMGRVTVKALEFSADGRTSGPLSYTIDRIGDRFYARSSEATGLFATIESADTLDGAKAACQADYEQRVLAALTSPPDHSGGEGE